MHAIINYHHEVGLSPAGKPIAELKLKENIILCILKVGLLPIFITDIILL